MEVKIKSATVEHLEDIRKAHVMLSHKVQKDFDDKTINREWAFSQDGEEYFKKRIIMEDGFVSVAYLDEKIVGYLIGEINASRSDRIPSDIAELESMFVADEMRGMGVGTKLCRAFEDWCKSKGIERMRVIVSTENKGAINFYRKNGYADYDLIMEKDI